MTVLRRLDAVLEPTKQAVLDMKASLDKAKIANQDQPTPLLVAKDGYGDPAACPSRSAIERS
jgi:hypothetical protein